MKIGDFHYPVDFVLLVTEECTENQVPIILGRPFLCTARANLDFVSGNMIVRMGKLSASVNVYQGLNLPVEIYESEDEDDAIIDMCSISFLHQSFPEDPM